MFRKKRVFFPPKKVTGKKQSNFIKRKKRIKSVLRRYLNYLHKKFSKVRISNKKFLLYKIKLLKYYYFLFNFLNRCRFGQPNFCQLRPDICYINCYTLFAAHLNNNTTIKIYTKF